MRLSNSTIPILFAGTFLTMTGLMAGACSSDDDSSTTTSTPPPGAGGGTSSSSGNGPGGAGGTSSTNVGGAGGSGGSGGSEPELPVDCSAPSGAEGALKLTRIAQGITHPILAKGAPGDLTRLFIVSQAGEILIYRDGELQPTPFLSIRDLVLYRGGQDERGLLGLAFHPDYQNNGRFFVHYSAADSGDTRVVEFKRGASPDVADPTPVVTFLEQDQPQANHNGGSIEFSPLDGFLYIGLGDGGNGGDQGAGHTQGIGNGQDLTTLLGKILRIDVSTSPYGIPPGNLTRDGARPEIWDYGMRNPYRFSFDACTADLYIGDVGQDIWEEVDVEPAGQGNKNYGWRLMEGTHCFNPGSNCDPQNVTTLPVVEYAQSAPVTDNCSVTGGYVYRGSNIPWLRGAYLYGDFCSGRIWTLRYQGGSTPEPVDRTDDLESLDFSIASFGQDTAGEVYLTDLGGSVYRIDAE